MLKHDRPLANRDELAQYLNERRLVGVGVEIGVHSGVFARCFLDHWQGRTYYLVDPWRDQDDYVDLAKGGPQQQLHRFSATLRNLLPHWDRCRALQLRSDEAVRFFEDDSLDFVYVDGNHSYEVASLDMRTWWPKLRPGGVLAGHDYFNWRENGMVCEVQSAVDDFCRGREFMLTGEAMSPKSWYLHKD